ncbi:MAG: cytochrome c [Trueperaceae bacterium]
MPTPRPSVTHTLLRFALMLPVLALAISLALAASPGDDADAAPPASLPIEEVQVELGADGYAQHCALCHGARLEGMDHFPPLTRTAFQRRWSERTLGELYTYVHDTMPLGAGGSLEDDTYAATVAYLLARNGVEAGETPFDPEDEEQLALPLALAGWAEGQ